MYSGTKFSFGMLLSGRSCSEVDFKNPFPFLCRSAEVQTIRAQCCLDAGRGGEGV
jgi:hypothetical protein